MAPKYGKILNLTETKLYDIYILDSCDDPNSGLF